MDTVNILTLVASSLTLVVSVITSILTYRLEKQKKRIESLEKNYGIALDNLEACYEIEGYLAERLNLSRAQLQLELNGWMKGKDIKLERDHYCPSFFRKKRTYLK